MDVIHDAGTCFDEGVRKTPHIYIKISNINSKHWCFLAIYVPEIRHWPLTWEEKTFRGTEYNRAGSVTKTKPGARGTEELIPTIGRDIPDAVSEAEEASDDEER